jgi:hypothetical protein
LGENKKFTNYKFPIRINQISDGFCLLLYLTSLEYKEVHIPTTRFSHLALGAGAEQNDQRLRVLRWSTFVLCEYFRFSDVQSSISTICGLIQARDVTPN